MKNLLLFHVLIASLGLVGQTAAQTFTTLHHFTNGFASNSDGGLPDAGLILSGNTLYGTTAYSTPGNGSVYKMNTNGTGFTTLYKFSIGGNPEARLVLSGSTLYGTATTSTSSGGSGYVFSLGTNVTGSITTVRSFTATSGPSPSTNSDGAVPIAGLILLGNTLYGTTRQGGSAGAGTVYTLKTSGANFTNLHNFTSTTNITNNDGAIPYAGLILSGNLLYGTATTGGEFGKGTVFVLNTNGTGFTTLHSFSALNNNTNSDGATPQGELVLSGNILYGTAKQGGAGGSGTIFKMNTDGTGFTTLHSFSALSNSTNSDGAAPHAGLILSGNTLYGTGYSGGSSGFGTVFALNTNGSDFVTLHSFSSLSSGTNSDGILPIAGLVLSGNTLYGTASNGGRSGWGTIFSLSFTPRLTIALSETNVILTWPTNMAGFSYAGYTLQSTTNLLSTNAWSTASPAPTVINGQNTVTNAVSGTQFYRLIK